MSSLEFGLYSLLGLVAVGCVVAVLLIFLNRKPLKRRQNRRWQLIVGLAVTAPFWITGWLLTVATIAEHRR